MKLFVLLFFLLFAVPASAQPNFVIFVGDDLGWPHYGFMGHDIVQTPRMDVLANTGTYFPVAFATSALCRPSNPSIATGLYNYQMTSSKKLLDTSTPTFASELRNLGYTSFTGGKWPANAAQGETASLALGFDVIAEEGPHVFGYNEETTESWFDFLDANQDGPWAAWLAPYNVHVPFRSDPEFKIYEDLDIKGRNKKYFAAITHMDNWFGTVIDDLEARGELQDTVIFYISDNGQNMKKAKGSYTQNGMRSPLIMWCGSNVHNCTNHGERSEIVSFTSIFPTILAMAGAPLLPGDYKGDDLRSPVGGNLVGHYSPKLGGQKEAFYVRTTDGYLYTVKKCGGKPVIWDLNVDPEDPPKIRTKDLKQPQWQQFIEDRNLEIASEWPVCDIG